MSRWRLLMIGAIVVLGTTPSAACVGDCDGDGTVTVDEVVLGVAIATGTVAVSQCAGADRDASQGVTVDEIIAAVSNALRGCVPFFVDATAEAGLTFDGHPATSAAAGDFDRDGWVDLYIVDRRASGRLYRNLGDGSFADVSLDSGLDTTSAGGVGPVWGDIDNDGDLDLYLTTNGNDQLRYRLFVNDGAGRFTEEARERGAAIETEHPHRGFSATFGDFDGDGYLDIHTTEWSPSLVGTEGLLAHARLLRNRGAERPGHFVDVTAAAGVDLEEDPFGFGLLISLSFASRFADLDDDGWPDLAVTSDFGTSRLFWNNGDGTFLNGTAAAGVGTDENGMGSAIDDFDGDGRLDWFVSSIFETDPRCARTQFICGWGTTGNRLYRNLGDRRFADATDAAGVRNGYWGWGSSFLDFDNDGDLDLVMTNGTLEEAADDSPFRTDPMRLWRNERGTMVEMSDSAGIRSTAAGKGLLVFDYDGDGDVDIFVGNDDAPPILYRNERGNELDWLRVDVQGHTSNRDGLGARVTVQAREHGPIQVREINAGSNFLGQSETTAHFGLGGGTAAVHEVRVRWPATGRERIFTEVPRRTTLVAVEPSE